MAQFRWINRFGAWPNGASWEDLPTESHPALTLPDPLAASAAWRRLLDPAGPRPGMPTTDDPDLHLVADGVRIDAMAQHGQAYIFAIPTLPRELRLVSRSSVPEQLGIAQDARELGVAISRIVARRGTRFRIMEASDAALVDGFHCFERKSRWRWTNGDARIPATLLEGGPELELVVHVACTASYAAHGIAA